MKTESSMIKKISVIIGALLLIVFINKCNTEQTSEEIINSFIDELLETENEKNKNRIQNYFNSVGVQSNREIYKAAKEARDTSLLVARNIRNIKIENNIPPELYQSMDNIKGEAATSYELLASAFNYAMEYYGGDLNKSYAFAFRENYDEAMKLQEGVGSDIIALEILVNSFEASNER